MNRSFQLAVLVLRFSNGRGRGTTFVTQCKLHLLTISQHIQIRDNQYYVNNIAVGADPAVSGQNITFSFLKLSADQG